MAVNNQNEHRGYNPVHELQQRLLLASSDDARLTAYMFYLPEIVPFDPSAAITQAGAASMVAIRQQNWAAQAEILRHRADAHILMNNAPAALVDLRNAYGNVEGDATRDAAVRISISIGRAHTILGDPISALREYQRALDLCGAGATSTRGNALEALADLHLTMGDYHTAIDILRQALALRTELKEQDGIGRALCAIGTAFGKMDDLAKAYEYHEQSLEVFRKAGDATNEIRALANLASIHQYRGELDEAIEFGWRAHAASESSNDWATRASLTITIADLLRQRGEFDVALAQYVKAYELLQEHPADDLLLGFYHRVGRVHEDMGDLDHAQDVYARAIEVAERIGERQVQSDLHKALSRVFELKGYYQEALAHYKQFATLQHELAGDEQRRKVTAVQVRHDMVKIEQELSETQSRAKKLEEDVEMKQQELVEAHIEILKQAGKHTEVSDTPARKSASGTEREWKKLKRQLDTAHPEFLKELFGLCPTLTPTEVKICALTKLLGEDTIEIARTLHNTPRTIQTQRLNIRKKLGLSGGVNFVVFISRL